MRVFEHILVSALLVLGITAGSVQAEDFGRLVLKYPVTDPEMTGDDLDEAIRSKSVELGVNHVFFAPLYKQVEALTGESYRHMTIHHLCDAGLARQLADMNDDLIVMMPCRIAVVESLKEPGKFSIYTTSPSIIMQDPSITQEQKDLILGFLPKMQGLTKAVASGDF